MLAFAGLLALCIGLCLTLLMGWQALSANGLAFGTFPAPALPPPGKLGACFLAGLAAAVFFARHGAVRRVEGLSSGLKARASTSLSVFLRKIKKDAEARPVAAGVSSPSCPLCGSAGASETLEAPLLGSSLVVCRGCRPRFERDRLDYARLSPRELDAVFDDARLRGRLGDERFLVGVAHLYENRGLLAALQSRPVLHEAEGASEMAKALELIGLHEAALAFLVLRPSFTPDDFRLFFRLHQRNGTLVKVPPESVPNELQGEFAEALLDSGAARDALGALERIPRAGWDRREFTVALRLKEKAGDLAGAESLCAEAARSLGEEAAAPLQASLARLCERLGRLDAAKTVYARLGGYGDSQRRLSDLERLGPEDAPPTSPEPGAPGRSAFAPAGALLHGRYRILKTLGRGALGFTFLAHDQKHDRAVAVKRVASHVTSDSALRDRLIRTATAAWHLEGHQGIAKFHKIVAYGPRLDLISEFVEGETLASVLTSRESLSAAEYAVYAREVLEALAWAHGRGVAHGGLSVAAVMRTRKGGVKVVDFGVGCGAEGPSAPSDILMFGKLMRVMAGGNLTGAGFRAELTEACLRQNPAERPTAAALLAAMTQA